jgi:transcriptional regulator with XRE-family HTH domain
MQECDINHDMSKRTKAKTMTEVLKAAIAECGETYSELERATDVKRGSLLRFMRGEQSILLDKADALAEHFGFELRLRKGR